MPTIPDSTKNSVISRLATRARERWPQIEQVKVRFKGGFGYVDAVCRRRGLETVSAQVRRLRQPVGIRDLPGQPRGLPASWLPTGTPSGTVEEALDTACGLYLSDPTAWT